MQLAVLDRHLTAPPASPADGDRYIVASGATGAWAGWDLNVAYWVDGAWMRLVPRPGWQAWVIDEATFLAWDGSSWTAAGLPAFFSDAVFQLAHDADPTRRAIFDLAGIAAGTVRAFALLDVSTELAGLSGAQTFDGDKIFAGELEASGPVATIGTAPGTVTYGVGIGATASGATKTVNLGTGGGSGSDTVVNIGSATPGADGAMVVNTPTVTFANGVTVVGMPQANLTALLLGLGGAVADAWNRLSVNTPAVLLNNAGAGIEATINKAAPANDASFAFKTGFSARALIGLLGSDELQFQGQPGWLRLLRRDPDRQDLGAGRAAEAGNPASRKQRPACTGIGQARALRPHSRRPVLARRHAIERAGFLAAAASRAGANRKLAAVLRRHHYHRGHVELHGRRRLDAGARGHFARDQHASLAPHLRCDSGLGIGPAQRGLHLLARQCLRARRLDPCCADLARHSAGDRHGLLRALRLDRRARHDPDPECRCQLHRHRLSARHPHSVAARHQ